MGLGITYALYPTFSARFFGFLTQQESTSTTSPTSSHSRERLPPTLVNPVMQLVAVRDIALGVAVLTFWNDGDNIATGKVILSGILIAIVDLFVLRGLGRGGNVSVGIAVGGSIWTLIGLGLLGW